MKPYPPEFMSIFQRPARRAVGVQCLVLHFWVIHVDCLFLL